MLDANILSYHIGFYVNISLMYLHDILDAFLLPINSKIHKSCKLKKKKNPGLVCRKWYRGT